MFTVQRFIELTQNLYVFTNHTTQVPTRTRMTLQKMQGDDTDEEMLSQIQRLRLLSCGTEHYFIICSSQNVVDAGSLLLHSTHFGAIHSFNKFAMLLMPILE